MTLPLPLVLTLLLSGCATASQGFDRSLMSAVGRGERELKEPTVDNFSSAANRRVEVIVR